jgi:carbon storage regulator
MEVTGMLVLTRKVDERIRIGNDIVITIVEIHGDKVRLGIEAPSNVSVHRQEVFDLIHQASTGVVPVAEAATDAPS